MYDEERMKGLRTVVMLLNVLLMVVTVTLQMAAFEPVRHVILCSCILLLVTATMIFDGILKDGKNLIIHGSWYVLWFAGLILNLFKI